LDIFHNFGKIPFMQYTNHFSKMIKVMGAPHLNSSQFQRMMNIIYIEASIDAIKSLDINGQDIFLKIHRMESKLKRLCNELEPEKLFKKMIELSEQ
jgi:hypothetical protein